jgi:hypothetical protein
MHMKAVLLPCNANSISCRPPNKNKVAVEQKLQFLKAESEERDAEVEFDEGMDEAQGNSLLRDDLPALQCEMDVDESNGKDDFDPATFAQDDAQDEAAEELEFDDPPELLAKLDALVQDAQAQDEYRYVNASQVNFT